MDLRQGEALAGYTIVRLLKQGGFGTVYEAEQRGRHGRVAVALKVLKHEMSSLSPVVATRFVNEAKVAASLETSYIARVFNWGTPEGEPPVGDYWIAMELLEGEDFADWVAHHGPLDLHEAVRVVNETCQVLAEAHAKGVIHRDIKPSNIFRATDVREAEGWMTKVLDFGIARTRSVAVGPTGALGTPGWIAPEQANSGEVIGSHTDIWALGLLAFYLMSGKSYWSAFQDDPAADVFQFYDELQRGVLPAASERAKALKARSLPIGFDAWFASCVNREQRFRSVELAALAFARLPTVEDIDPHDVSPVPRAPKRKVAPVPPAQAALGNQSDLHPPALGTPPGIVVPERVWHWSSPPDFAQVARGYGAHGVTVTDAETLEREVRRALRGPGPVIIEAKIDPAVRVPASDRFLTLGEARP